MRERIESLPVYRDGNAVIVEDFRVLEDESGETFVTLQTAIQWEAMHDLVVSLARFGHLPGSLAQGCGMRWVMRTGPTIPQEHEAGNRSSWLKRAGTMPGGLHTGR